MRAWLLPLALLALATGCRGALPPTPLAATDPRPRALLEAWRAHASERKSLYAVARFAVDAPGAGVAGEDLALRSKQRLWLARPAMLRVEVLGFLDTTLAVLATDGESYALLQAAERSFDAGPVYAGLLWDAARLDLRPEEAVEVILGVPHPDADLAIGAAQQVGEALRIELADAAGRVRRVVEFGAAGELRGLEQRETSGEAAWSAAFDDFVVIGGAPFAREVALRSGSGRARAELRLRGVELNPDFSPDIFQLRAPDAGGPASAGGAWGG